MATDYIYTCDICKKRLDRHADWKYAKIESPILKHCYKDPIEYEMCEDCYETVHNFIRTELMGLSPLSTKDRLTTSDYLQPLSVFVERAKKLFKE